MRTEDDIRAALTTLEREAPDPRSVLEPLAGGPPAPRLSRPRVLVAVAAATTLVVGAGPVLRALSSGDSATTVPTAGHRWEYTFDLALPTGWRLSDRTIDRTPNQTATLITPAGKLCGIDVFGTGMFDPARITEPRTKLDISGHTGFVARVKGLVTRVRLDGNGTATPVDIPRTVVVWEYAANAWAMSDCNENDHPRTLPIADELTAARSVITARQTLLLPFRLMSLPDGWESQAVTVEGPTMAGGHQPDIWVNFGPRVSTNSSTHKDVGKQKGFQPAPPMVSVLVSKGKMVSPGPGSVHTTLDGHPAWLTPDDQGATILAYVAGYEIRVQGRPVAEVQQVAASLRLADPASRSTWFDGTEAIP
jgi:hypothetical protein